MFNLLSIISVISKSRYKFVIYIVLFVGTLFSFYVYKQLINLEITKNEARFQFEIKDKIDYLKTNIERHKDILNSTAAFFQASSDVSRQAFNIFTNQIILNNDSITGLSWNPLIKNEEKQRYIEMAREDGIDNFSILGFDSNKNLIEDKNKESYISVFYIEPIQDNIKALGFDISSNLSRKIAIEKARDSAQIVMTETIKLVQKNDVNASGYLMMKAIYKKNSVLNTIEDRQKNFLGVVVGVFHFDKLILASMKIADSNDFYLNIFDFTDSKEQNLIYEYSNNVDNKTKNLKEFFYDVDILNRKWHIVFNPSFSFFEKNKEYTAQIFLICGLLITFMSAFLLTVLFKDNQILIKNYLNSQEYADIMKNKIDEQTKKIIEEKNKFEALINYSSDAIMIISPNDAKVLIFNKMAEILLGYNSEEFKELSVLSWDRDMKDIEDFYNLIYSLKNIPITLERTHTKKDGSTYDALITAVKIKINNQDLIYTAARDISDLKKKEKLLIEQSKMVSIGEMIGNISHQWRQPLSSISVRATGSILKKENDLLSDEEFYENMKAINHQVQYLSNTIETFRNFLKNDKEIGDVILQEEIEKSIYIVDAALKSNHISLVTELEKNPIILKQAQGELQQVLINIINNSKDAIKENKVSEAWIKVILEEKNKMVTIKIEDNAGGIPFDVLPRIFEPYFTTKHKSQGTGLGLHISYIIITQSLKGNIYAKNNDYNGATFIIELPLEN